MPSENVGVEATRRRKSFMAAVYADPTLRDKPKESRDLAADIMARCSAGTLPSARRACAPAHARGRTRAHA